VYGHVASIVCSVAPTMTASCTTLSDTSLQFALNVSSMGTASYCQVYYGISASTTTIAIPATLTSVAGSYTSIVTELVADTAYYFVTKYSIDATNWVAGGIVQSQKANAATSTCTLTSVVPMSRSVSVSWSCTTSGEVKIICNGITYTSSTSPFVIRELEAGTAYQVGVTKV
jgi:hypothetical protein